MGTTQLGLLEFGTVSKDKPIELTPWQFSIIVSHDESFYVFLWQVAATSNVALVFHFIYEGLWKQETFDLGAEYETRTRNTCLEGKDVPNYTNSALTRHIFNSYLLITIQMLLKFLKFAVCVFQYKYYIIIYFKSQIFDF